MIKIGNKLREQGRPAGCINDTVAYTPKSEEYPTISEINKLSEMLFKEWSL